MPRTGDTYALPAGGAVAGAEAKATDVTTPLADLEAEQNLARPVSAGGTGATTAAGALSNLGADTWGTLPALTGHAYDTPRVNAGETATEFVDTTSGMSIFATCAGTANALTLTTGLSLTELVDGQEFRFKVAHTNTSTSVTVAIDGLATVQIYTLRKDATDPCHPGFLTAGEYVIGRMEGTANLIVRWESPQVATGYIRHDNGLQECWGNVTLTQNAASSVTGTFTYAKAFSAAPLITCVENQSSSSCTPAIAERLAPAVYSTTTTTTAKIRQSRVSGLTDFASGDTTEAMCRAVGLWY